MADVFVHFRKVRTMLGVLGLLAGHAVAQAGAAESMYRQECNSCHIAYPAGMLPAASWRRLLANMDKHFGTNASLEPRVRKQVENWLMEQAGSYRRVHGEPPQDRITLSNWFIRKHDEVSASVWKRASVGSASNCSACHVKAAEGDFSEHRVRIPK